MGSVKKPIKIFARLKPLAGEPSTFNIEPVDSDETNDEILILSAKNPNYAEDSYHSKGTEMHRYRYSKVLERDTSQEQVFDNICRPVLDSAVAGYNGTVFAYGQTGSGKTFTMTGSRVEYAERGMIPRALSYVFEKFQEFEDGTEIQSVFISYLEIYNENGYDLLNPGFISGKLEDLSKVILMEDSHQQIHLKNLSIHPVVTEDEALQLFYLGEHTRTVAETPMNEASTRSHCIFTIHLNIRQVEGSMVRRSKLHLVDLAGSERIAHSNITGQLLNEARHINLALHYLEQVIVALGEANRSHIPYRNSMMTSILRDSLGGNCMTSMIATLSLEPKNISETLSTCRFSQRVALVTNAATLNEQVDPDMMIAKLKAEVKRLKATIAGSSIKPITNSPVPLSSDEITDCWNVVQSFLVDMDENAILPISPDMRLIQTCFRCLKMACNLSKSKASLKTIKFNLPDTESFPQSQKVKELLKTLAHRDSEIKILTKMLRQEKDKNCQSNFQAISGMDVTDVSPDPDNSEPEPPTDTSRRRDDDNSIAQLHSIADQLECPPYSPVESPKSLLNDKESFLSEGLTGGKKTALNDFLATYSAQTELLDTRKELLEKKVAYDEIEEDMHTNQANLSQLKRIMTTAMHPDEEELKNEILVEAYEAQKRTLGMQQERLDRAKEELTEAEDNLKVMYKKLMNDFEDWWNNNDPNQESLPLNEYETNKPLKEVATGIFKKTEVETKTPSDFERNEVPSKKSERSEWSENSHSSKNNQSLDKTQISNKSPRKTSGKKASPRIAPTVPPMQILDSKEKKVLETLPNEVEDEDLPMTGDPETDKEILAFFRTRRAVFRKINEDKKANQQVPV